MDKNIKGKRAREVPLIDGIRGLVTRRIELAGNDLDARLFTGPRGGRISTATLRDATSWDEVVAELGYEHLTRHGLRHTGLTLMADAGVPLHRLRKIVGHGTLTTTQRYLHPRPAVPHQRRGVALAAFVVPNFESFTRPHRALHRRTPIQAFNDRPKAFPAADKIPPHYRVRHDKIDAAGVITIRYNSRLHHIGLSKRRRGTKVTVLIDDLDIRVLDRDTGTLIRKLVLDPTRDYQPRGVKCGNSPENRLKV